MKKQSRSFALILALVIISTPGLKSSNLVNAQPETVEGSAALQVVAATPALISAIFELESDPLVVHLNSNRPPELLGRPIQMESVDAYRYESRLLAEQESFKSRAALLSPNLRVVAQLRRLANAVSIKAPGAEIARLTALPGVKRVELVKRYHKTLDASLPLLRTPALWNKLGGSSVAGQGMKIAI